MNVYVKRSNGPEVKFNAFYGSLSLCLRDTPNNESQTEDLGKKLLLDTLFDSEKIIASRKEIYPSNVLNNVGQSK